MAKSNYLENKTLDHNLGTAAYTMPSGVYVALYTTDPTDADSGSEVTGGSYARQAATFGSATGGAAANTGAVTFTGMPAATVTHFGLRDAASAGNLLYHGSLTAPKTTGSGDDLEFAIGDIDVTES